MKFKIVLEWQVVNMKCYPLFIVSNSIQNISYYLFTWNFRGTLLSGMEDSVTDGVATSILVLAEYVEEVASVCPPLQCDW